MVSTHDGLALGLLESASLARGLEAADAVWKQAPVEPLWTRALEPGKLIVAFTGAVDAVREALARGRLVLGNALLGDLMLAGPDPQLLAAAQGLAPAPEPSEALGLVECSTVAATLQAADAGVKAAQVELFQLRFEPAMGGKALACFAGSEADVESAVYRAAELAEARSALVRVSVITGPASGLVEACRDL